MRTVQSVPTDEDLHEAFQEHRQAVYRFAWRMMNSAAAAEDVLQDVFLAALSQRDRFTGTRGSLRCFLLGVARNLVLKRLRKESRWVALDEELAAARVDEPVLDDVGGAVAAAIQQLPPLQREALLLATYGELPLIEIARLTGAEVSVVKARLHRARENLKRMLAPLRANMTRSANGTPER